MILVLGPVGKELAKGSRLDSSGVTMASEKSPGNNTSGVSLRVQVKTQ